jgi:hypothetical protein
MDFLKIFFLLFPEDNDFTVLFWSASSGRPCIQVVQKKLSFIARASIFKDVSAIKELFTHMSYNILSTIITFYF